MAVSRCEKQSKTESGMSKFGADRPASDSGVSIYTGPRQNQG
ncbi:hypothetical protein RRG08_001977 [Elysia crispata]|uniref:Uncharacterized protein n=1 Tax=Elysia crispata TaxID=231223 RepID=A0AAE1BAU2_9GAST|nr:hypothetical protein RRG08_001977 [Elysia crispata]